MLPHGRYFLRDFLFDLRQLLYVITDALRVVKNVEGEFPEDLRVLSAKWQPTIDVWITRVSGVLKQIDIAQDIDQDWESLIQRVGQTLEGASELKNEASQLGLPADESTGDFVGFIKQLTARVEEYRRLIETQEYKEQWAELVRHIEQFGQK